MNNSILKLSDKLFIHIVPIIIFQFLFSCHIYAQDKERALDSLVSGFDTNTTPGAVIGIVKDGEIEIQKAYGMANLTHSVPITMETKFNLGSVSKQFTAFAILLLDQRDSLSLEDPIQEYLPEIPNFDQKVTIKNLLTHTSGLRESYYPSILTGVFPDQDHLTRQQAIDVVVNQPKLEFNPGSEFTYNSSAYVLLAEIIERVTEEPFSDWMQKNVFQPFGMDNTVIEMETEQVIPGAADSYKDAEEEGYITDFSNRAYYGAADIYTTVGDMVKWMNNFDNPKVGGKEIIDQMTTPYIFSSGESTKYGYGLDIDEYRGLKRYYHNGAHAGYRAYFSYFPELDGGVVFMQNYSPIPLLLGPAVEDIYFGNQMEQKEEEQTMPSKLNKKKDEIEISSSLLEKYEGAYRDQSGTPAFKLVKKDKDLVMHLKDQKFPLFAISDTVFGSEQIPFRVVFTSDPNGNVEEGYVQARTNYPFSRINDFNYASDDLESYVGTYFSPELKSFQRIIFQNGELYIISPREEPASIRGFEKDSFDATQDDFIIRFKRNDEGELKGFYISEGRTKNIWFEKKDDL